MFASRVAAVALTTLAMTLLAPAGAAHAHSFLAATDPVQGARLDAAPDDVALQLSEAVAADSVAVTVRRSAETELELPAPGLRSGAVVVRQPLPPLPDGVYVVSWHVTSAVDGHESAGEFAFAVGDAGGGELASATAVPTDVDPWSAVATWSFFVGLAVAAGGLAGPALLGAAAGPARRWLRPWLRAGVGIGLVGVAAHVATEQVFTGPPTLAGAALVVVVVLLLLAALAARLASILPAAGAVAGAVIAWSARSHSAATQGVLGWLLDATHLAAAALWTGALAFVVAALWRGRGDDRRALLAGVGRYARFATWLVAAVAATGVVQAVLLLPDIGALWSTGYGRVITVKSVLFAAALAAAAGARGRALPRARPRLLQRLTAGEASVLAGVLAAAAILINGAPPQPASAAGSLLGPPPIEGPVVHDMGLAGALTVDIAAGGDRLDVEVLSPQGGVDGARVALVARYPDGTSAELHPRPCGAGCYTQELGLPDGVTQLQVTASAPDWAGGTMSAQLRWPPAPAQPERFDRMVDAMRAVPELRVAESVSSGPDSTDPGPPQGPGMSLSGERFVSLMPWASGGVTDVRPVADEPSAFTFYLPGSTMYFVVRVDEQDRLVQQHMVNAGHQIDHRFSYPKPSA